MIPPAFIQELLARVDIVDVVGRQLQLKKSGINFSGLCPFHAEKSPSFTVTPTKQFYHCFGCGAHGDAIRFLIEQNGMTFVDAVKDLAQQVGLKVPDDDASPEDRERAAAQKQRRATLSDVLAKAAEHYRRQLKASPRAIGYLKNRSVTGEIAARFGLGYAPEGWRTLASVFPSYDDPLLEESGMVIVHEADNGDEAQRKRYDRFRDRIMFPIRSVQGDIIGFGGRILDRGEPKYLNSPETPVFSKGRELYGLHEARTAVRQRGYALVVEGYMDVVALAQAGFGNAVATLGTACTAEHVQKLFRFTDSVVFSFDGDAAGRRAANRALEASLAHATDTRSIRFLFLPAEHDPDSFVRERGPEAFESLIAAAVPLSRQLLEAASDGCDLETAEGRARLVAQARPFIGQLPEGMLRGQIVDALAAAARVGADELRQQFGGARPEPERRWVPPGSFGRQAPMPAPGGASTPRQRSPRRPLSPMATSLDRAVWLMIHRADLWDQLGHEAHALLTEQPPPHGAFFSWLDRLIHDQGALAPAALMAELHAETAPPALSQLYTRVGAFHDMPVGDEARTEIDVIVDRLRLGAAQSELELLAGSQGLSEAAKARQRELIERQRQLKDRLSRPSVAGA
ncbi:MAG TPA: DNA primase [Caldimonas sp.]